MDSIDEDESWQRPAGLFVIAAIEGPAAARIADIQRRYDPKFAAAHRPHVTLVGSSGLGPISASISAQAVRTALEPIAAVTPRIDVRFGAPHRFMQSNVVSLPLDPHGPLRALHDRIARSGLVFGPARFTFTPHVTLNFYPAPPRELLAERVTEAAFLTHLTVSATEDPLPPKPLFDLALSG